MSNEEVRTNICITPHYPHIFRIINTARLLTTPGGRYEKCLPGCPGVYEVVEEPPGQIHKAPDNNGAQERGSRRAEDPCHLLLHVVARASH